MKRIITLAALAALSVGAGMFARATMQSPGFTPYTLQLRVVDYDAMGRPSFNHNETHIQASNGRRQVVRVFPDGRQELTLTEPGQGVFRLRGGRMVFLSDALAEQPTITVEQVRSSPQFVREDTVHGIPVLVSRSEKGGTAFEAYRAPSLNWATLKIVTEPGEGRRRVHEPLSLKTEEPDPRVFAVYDAPVDRSFYEKQRSGGKL